MNKSLVFIIVFFSLFLSSCMCYVPWAKGFVGCCLPSGLSCQMGPKESIQQSDKEQQKQESNKQKKQHYVY